MGGLQQKSQLHKISMWNLHIIPKRPTRNFKLQISKQFILVNICIRTFDAQTSGHFGTTNMVLSAAVALLVKEDIRPAPFKDEFR